MELNRYRAPAYYLALGLVLLISSQLRPHYNWDLIAYVAAAKRIETSDPAEIHRFVYEELRQSVPPDVYAERVSGNEYQAAVAADPETLAEQLRFYRFRPVYAWAVYLFYRAGVDMVFASHLVSGLSVFLGICLLYLLGRRRLAPPFLYTLPILALAMGLLQIARLSTPDGLAVLGVFGAAHLFLGGRPALALLAPALIAVRTDLILFALPLLLYLLLKRPDRRAPFALAIAASMFLTWYLPERYGNPGWLTTFYFWFVEPNHALASSSVVPTLNQYLLALVRGMWEAANDATFVVYIAVAGWTLALLLAASRRAGGWGRLLDSRMAALALICIGYVAAHFVLYPDPAERYFVAEYTLTTLILFALLSE